MDIKIIVHTHIIDILLLITLNNTFKLINHSPPLLKSNISVYRLQACFRYEMSAFNDCYKSVLSFSKQTFFLPLHCVSNIFVNFAFLFFIENYQVDVVNIKVNTGKMLYETPRHHQNNNTTDLVKSSQAILPAFCFAVIAGTGSTL